MYLITTCYTIALVINWRLTPAVEKEGSLLRSFNTYKVSAEHTGLTVEEYLKTILHYSGRKIQKLTRQKGIFLNGKKVYLQKKIKPDDTVRVLVLEDVGYGVQPEPGPVEVLYEDDFVIVLNKPAYQLVHPTGQTVGGTLANFLAHYLQQRGVIATIRPVHRLDRETSGCVIFAKDSRSQFIMEQQLKERILKRTYLALVMGIPNPLSGTVGAPIGPHPDLPNRRAISEKGEAAVTHYRTIQTFANASLLELSLDTGRTHQIRVHMTHIGHSIIGDKMYGARAPYMNRQALHATSVTFKRLADQQETTVQAPLPEDFTQAIDVCTKKH